VVNNKQLASSDSTLPDKPIIDKAGETDTMHALPAGVSQSLSALKAKLNLETQTAPKVDLLTAIANGYKKANRFDSAGAYFEKAASLANNPNLVYEAGNAYFEGIAFAGAPSKVEYLSAKARALLSQVPEGSVKSTESQAKMALTWVNSETPMKGILKLRELAEKEPDNEFVVYQLGILSFQSGQYDKAVGRFKKVIEINPKSVNGYFYLAQSLTQLGQNREALAAVQKGMPLAKEEDTKASFEELKKQLSGN